MVLTVVCALLAAPAAAPAPTPAAAPVGRPVGLLFVIVTFVARLVIGIVASDGLRNRLGCDKQRHVVRPLHPGLDDLHRLLGFQHQARFGFVGLGGFAGRIGHLSGHGVRGLLALLGLALLGRLLGQQVAHPDRIDAVHTGMGAANPPIERTQRIQHPTATGSQRSRQ